MIQKLKDFVIQSILGSVYSNLWVLDSFHSSLAEFDDEFLSEFFSYIIEMTNLLIW